MDDYKVLNIGKVSKLVMGSLERKLGKGDFELGIDATAPSFYSDEQNEYMLSLCENPYKVKLEKTYQERAI